MRILFTIVLCLSFLSLWGQARLLPQSMNQLRPERCGIRFIESRGNMIDVILEFEKKARIITPDNPEDVKGKSVNLRGVYYLTYDQSGSLISERRSFLQTGEIPDRGMVFGLNGQRADLLESDLHLISQEEFDSIPWVVGHGPAAKPLVKVEPDTVYNAELQVDKDNKLVSLDVQKHIRSQSAEDGFDIIESQANLEFYDSCSKKAFWTNLYLPSTDPLNGTTLAMLNFHDKKIDKEPSQKRWRLVSFDSIGLVKGQYDFEFDQPMGIAYRDEITSFKEGVNAINKQIWVFQPSLSTDSRETINQYHYYAFNTDASLRTSAKIVTSQPVFNSINDLWLKQGVIFTSNQDHVITTCYISNNGDYEIFSSGDRMDNLKRLFDGMTGNHRRTITLQLHQTPTIFEDSTILAIYKVQEDVGVGAAQGVVSDATIVHHGMVVLHMNPNGQILASDYYQRPVNADPRAPVALGPIERNNDGLISFYAYEQTSIGTYPVLYTVKGNKVSMLMNDKGTTASRFIYYDSEEAIVGYFGVVKDPNDPRIAFHTLEILVNDD